MELRKRRTPIFLTVALAVAGLALLASAPSFARSSKTAAPAQQLTLYVFRGVEHIMGPDGKSHDTIVPATFVVKAGIPVKLTVINYDESNHSITAPGLNLNLVIKPGKKVGNTKTISPVSTTLTFTATKTGVFRWHCNYPCDKGANLWAMGQGYGGPGKEGFMAGYIVVI